MKKLQELYDHSTTGLEYAREYMKYLIAILQSLDYQTIEKIMSIFEQAQINSRKIYFAGNGGSASTCGHFINDLKAAVKKNKKTKRLDVIDLTSNLATITALANDVGYSEVFVGQIENIINAEDILVVISASGSSVNLVKAAKYAKSRGALVVGFLGFDGGALKNLCDCSLIVKTPQGQYGPVEDIHLILNHLISSYLFFKQSAPVKVLAQVMP